MNFKVFACVCVLVAVSVVMAAPTAEESAVNAKLHQDAITAVAENPSPALVRGKRQGLLGVLAVGALAGVVGYGLGAHSHGHHGYHGAYPPYGAYPPQYGYGGYYGKK